MVACYFAGPATMLKVLIVDKNVKCPGIPGRSGLKEGSALYNFESPQMVHKQCVPSGSLNLSKSIEYNSTVLCLHKKTASSIAIRFILRHNHQNLNLIF